MMARNTAGITIMNAQISPQSPDDERAAMLADIATSGNEDAAECAAADLTREFPPLP